MPHWHWTVCRKSMRSGRSAWISAEASTSFRSRRVSVRCSGGWVTLAMGSYCDCRESSTVPGRLSKPADAHRRAGNAVSWSWTERKQRSHRVIACRGGSGGGSCLAFRIQFVDAGQALLPEHQVKPVEEQVMHLLALLEGQGAKLLVDGFREIDRRLLGAGGVVP